MFLDVLRRRNPDFLGAVVALHREGAIPPNSYVLDLDAIGANAATLVAEADRLGLTLYAMTKQQGRNPAAMATMSANGIGAGVAVDIDCARGLVAGEMPVGHVGHLVQIASGEAAEVAAMEPHHWTVFNEAKAGEAGAAATALGRSQRLLARVHAPGDGFYPGHEGGFEADDVLRVAEALDAVPGAEFAGLTTFPALLFDSGVREVRPTLNLATLERAAARLRAAGREEVEINAPGTTSTRTLSVLADAGATQVEPGHALTGTTPWHALEDLPELPAMCYLSEVSHVHDGRSYCFGGGLYVDPVFPPYQVRALVGSDPEAALANPVDAQLPPADAIDYYGQLDTAARPGDTVVFGFRAQAFVTRAAVAAVSGIAAGEPRLEGIWGPDGRPHAGGAK